MYNVLRVVIMRPSADFYIKQLKRFRKERIYLTPIHIQHFVGCLLCWCEIWSGCLIVNVSLLIRAATRLVFLRFRRSKMIVAADNFQIWFKFYIISTGLSNMSDIVNQPASSDSARSRWFFEQTNKNLKINHENLPDVACIYFEKALVIVLPLLSGFFTAPNASFIQIVIYVRINAEFHRVWFYKFPWLGGEYVAVGSAQRSRANPLPRSLLTIVERHATGLISQHY